MIYVIYSLFIVVKVFFILLRYLSIDFLLVLEKVSCSFLLQGFVDVIDWVIGFELFIFVIRNINYILKKIFLKLYVKNIYVIFISYRIFFFCLFIYNKVGKKILGYIVEINYMEMIFLLYCKDENDIIKFNI